MAKKTMFTHDIAADIVNMFEDVLVKNNICVPSPDDEDRSEEDMIGLYGTTYYKLIDDTENILKEVRAKARTGEYDVVYDIYGGKCYEE